jgi:hypothetical protein
MVVFCRAVGANIANIPDGVTVVDAEGKLVLPGIHSYLCLSLPLVALAIICVPVFSL